MDFVGGRTQGVYLERTWYSAYHLARRVACDLTSRDSGRSDHAMGAPPQLVDGEQLAAAVASAACPSRRQRWSAVAAGGAAGPEQTGQGPRRVGVAGP